MDEKQARALVRDTFQQAFDRSRFERFLRELLNRYEEKPLRYHGAYIPDAFKAHVASLERIGTYTAPGNERVDLLIVHVAKHSTLARARTALRNYVAHHLKTRDGKDAALVAFASPSDPTWRFSYVRMEYETATDARGRVNIRTELTPARRLSYLVGHGESCHTAQSRFVDLLRKTTADPSIEELEEAFSVEAVTKEFFEQYKSLYLDVTEELDAIAARDKKVRDEFHRRRVDLVDFTKKLLGQIVFLYFLQRKGWLGVARHAAWGDGPRDFVRRLANGEFGEGHNIFNDLLEPLFYDTLAVDRGPDAWTERFGCRIPFLNGGLFEPLCGYDWQNTDIVIPNRLFTNSDLTPAGDVGTGILDVFDRYNFTVNEAEPLEVEVAIDPEMLGKVFENLLEVRERKSKGSFYTPREIVHYMCQEALIDYLDNAINGIEDISLVNVSPTQRGLFGEAPPVQGTLATRAKRLVVPRNDLALLIQSGEQASHWEAARKEGTLSYRRELPKSIELNASLIDEKLASVRVCDPAIGSGAFVVGMMTEVVRARSALNAYLAGGDDRSPYAFKRNAIHSCLYGVDIDVGAVEIAKLRLWLSLVVDEVDVASIKPLPNLDYKIVAGNSLLGFPFQSSGLQQLERKKDELTETADPDRKEELRGVIRDAIERHLASSEKTLGHRVDFDFRLFFSEVFAERAGFDIVIANPPYVSAWDMERSGTAGRRAIESRFAHYKILKGHWDLYVAFLVQAFDILNKQGVVTYVVPNPVLREKYASGLRCYVLRNMTLLSLLTFQETNMFAKVSRKTVVLVIDRSGRAAETVPLLRYHEVRRGEGFIAFDRDVDLALWRDDPTCQFRIDASADLESITAKIESSGVRLGNICYVNYGAQLASKRPGAFKKKDIVGKERKGNAKPFYDGKDLQRWSISSRKLFVDYRKSELYGPRTEKLFEGPKIAIRNISDRGHKIAGMLDETGWYCDHTVVLAVPYSQLDGTELRTSFEGYEHLKADIPLEFITAVLLSKPATFYYRVKYSNESLQQATSHIFPQQLRAMPVPLASPEVVRSVVSIVRRVVTCGDDELARTAFLEELEDATYAAFDLLNERDAIEEFLSGEVAAEDDEGVVAS